MKTTVTTVTNQALGSALWLHLIPKRDDLREIARAKGIPRGRSANDTARNLANAPAFPIRLTIEIEDQ
jgi:hypothetical protein